MAVVQSKEMAGVLLVVAAADWPVQSGSCSSGDLVLGVEGQCSLRSSLAVARPHDPEPPALPQ